MIPSFNCNYWYICIDEACSLISGYAEGCDVTSMAPVCDADSSTFGIQDTATAKVAQCVACKKAGRNIELHWNNFTDQNIIRSKTSKVRLKFTTIVERYANSCAAIILVYNSTRKKGPSCSYHTKICKDSIL